MANRKQKHQISRELVDQLLGAASEEAQAKGPEAILKELTGAVVNRVLETELTAHLDYEAGTRAPEHQDNRRNGHRRKTLRTDRGDVEIAVPRDRDGTFEPQFVKPYQRAIPGFDDKILSMYARGMSTREIRGFIKDEYDVDVSPDLVSQVTDSVVEELQQWQGRTLQAVYPIVYLDALVVKSRDAGAVENKSLYMVIGVDDTGHRDVLGLWMQKTEGAKFWLSILTELRHRGVEDILFLCADGLTGLPEAVEAAFPKTVFQTCVVHLIRASTRLVPWKDKKAVCRDLKCIYTAENIRAAELAVDEFDRKWGGKYSMVAKAWRDRFHEWSPFLAYSSEVRRAIYTTNTIEATNRQLRKVLKTKGHLPNDDAVYKLVYLVLRTNRDGWRKNRTARDWKAIKLQLAIHFPDRIELGL